MPIIGTIASSTRQGLATGSYESIATATITSGTASQLDFTSIPQTYTHLQLRFMAKLTATGDLNLRVGTGSPDAGNYTYHLTYGSNASISSGASSANVNRAYLGYYLNATSVFAVGVVDILDYSNTNKAKTISCIQGSDTNANGIAMLNSSVWRVSTAIDCIRFFSADWDMTQNTHVALYGIKSA